MSKMKKIIAFLSALFMMITMSVPVMAETIDVRNEECNRTDMTYTYYVMMKMGETNGVIEYYVEDEKLAEALLNLRINGEHFCKVTEVLGKDYWSVDINEEADFTEKEIGEALATIKEYAVESGIVDNYQIELDYGALILVESGIGTTAIMETSQVPMLVDKNQTPTIWLSTDVQNAEIGGIVNYTINVYTRTAASSIKKICGTMTEGLTVGDTCTITWTDGTEQTQSVEIVSNEDGYTADISTICANMPSHVNTLSITYSATMNAKAKAAAPENNAVCLEYGDNEATSNTDECDVYTFGFQLKKVSKGEQQGALGGAGFTLTKVGSENTPLYYTVKDGTIEGFQSESCILYTDENGVISFDGLAAGTYTLTETEAAAGYGLLGTPVVVTIDNSGKASIGEETDTKVENTEKSDSSTIYYGTVTVTDESVVIADTGGAGTTSMYVLGCILVMASCVLYGMFRKDRGAAS